jgi:hypothetical protein
LAGFIQQTYNLDREIIRLARDSLLGEEGRSKPYYSVVLPRSLSSLRIPFFTLFILLVVGLMFANQGRFSLFQSAKKSIWGKVRALYSQTSGSIPSSVSALPLDTGQFQNPPKNEARESAEKLLREGSQ